MNSANVDAAQVVERLAYDPDTGVFTWKARAAARECDNSRWSGKVAGKLDTRGYRQINLCGKRVLAHRLAWLVMTGRWPANQIDHRNGNRDDNRFANLREASPGDNNQNVAKAKGKLSAWLGVSRASRGRRRWTSRIMVGGRSWFLGVFDTEDAARDAYLAAKAELHRFQPTPRDGGGQ